MAELHGEKIDIVDYSDEPADFVANALSPARVTRVEVIDRDAMEARVTVPDYQLSLAIGKEGQNARLAARLTGWRIDIRSDGAVGASAPAPRASTAETATAQTATAGAATAGAATAQAATAGAATAETATAEAANAAGASADAS
jgi:N utilization substance protein A